MTGKDIYTAALAVVSQTMGDNDRWDELAVQWLNIALGEAMYAENALRHYYFRTPLDAAPRLKSLEDTVPYHERLFSALVELLAAYLWTDADEGFKAQDCRNRAADNLNEVLQMCRPEKVKDVY